MIYFKITSRSMCGRLVAQLNFDLLHVKFDKMYDFE